MEYYMNNLEILTVVLFVAVVAFVGFKWVKLNAKKADKVSSTTAGSSNYHEDNDPNRI